MHRPFQSPAFLPNSLRIKGMENPRPHVPERASSPEGDTFAPLVGHSWTLEGQLGLAKPLAREGERASELPGV